MSVSNVGTLRNQSATSGSSLDAEQERALFQLMGQLEQILVRMDDIGASKRLPGSIEVAKELLVELVDFSEKRYEKDLTTPLVDQVCDFHESTKRLEKMLGGQSWSGFAALIGIKMSYSDEIKAMFQQLGRDVLAVVGGFFQLFESRFASPDQASEWHANSQVFLDDIVRRWKIDDDRRS
jgi:hypothetical protein